MPLMMPGLCIMTGTYIVVKTLEIGRHWNLVQVFETMMNSIKTFKHLCRKRVFYEDTFDKASEKTKNSFKTFKLTLIRKC